MAGTMFVAPTPATMGSVVAGAIAAWVAAAAAEFRIGGVAAGIMSPGEAVATAGIDAG